MTWMAITTNVHDSTARQTAEKKPASELVLFNVIGM